MIPSGLSTMTAMFYRELEGKTNSRAITRLSAGSLDGWLRLPEYSDNGAIRAQ